MKAPSAPLKGIFSALVTPMTRSQEVDWRNLERFTRYLIDAGVHGLTPLGSTGEFYALTADERARVLETVLDAADGKVPVVPGTNAGSTRDVVAFSKQAEKQGCAGVMLAAVRSTVEPSALVNLKGLVPI